MEQEFSDNSNFEGLVQGISSSERQTLLEKVRQDDTEQVYDEEYKILSDDAERNSNPRVNLVSHLRQESLLRRFLFWLMSAFSNLSLEQIYNNHLVSNVAKEIERKFPGIIDYKKKQFSALFHDKLTQIKRAQEFFEPFVEVYEGGKKDFLTHLGKNLLPAVDDAIRTQSDPYQYPFSMQLTKESRNSLLHKMFALIDGISENDRSVMYVAIKSIEWLRQFCQLPVARMLQHFNSTDEGKSCDFTALRGSFDNFVNVLCSPHPFTQDTFVAFFRFVHEQAPGAVSRFSSHETEDAEREFTAACESQLAVISTFVETVPLKKLLSIVYEKALMTVSVVGGGEGWHSQYKEQWKIYFDKRWAMWQKDYAKEALKEKLSTYFSISDFPMFPYRPWAGLWGGVPFAYELTLGFINYFFKTEFPKYSKTLKTLVLEGEFSIKENRMEFTDVLNEIGRMDEELDLLSSQLSSTGEYGQVFERYRGSDRTHSAQEKITSLIHDIQHKAKDLLAGFGKICREVENLLSGVLSEKITVYHGPVLNLSKINGRANKSFVDQIYLCKNSVEYALEMVKELEPLDSPL